MIASFVPVLSHRPPAPALEKRSDPEDDNGNGNEFIAALQAFRMERRGKTRATVVQSGFASAASDDYCKPPDCTRFVI